MYLQTLSDGWQIRPLTEFRQGIYPRDEEGWLDAPVPAHWQQIPALASHAGKVVYRCRFAWDEGPPTDGARRWLRLNGVFYRSRPYLNGVDLGAHEGYFIPLEREVGPLLQPENELLVEVDCPDERDKFGKKMITGVFSHWDCLDPQANPGGIWLPVELHASGPLRLGHARLRTEALDGRVAQVRFGLHLDAAAAGPATVAITFTPRTFPGEAQRFEQRRTLRAGPQEIGGLLKLRDPRLWWTHDLGRPDLYNVSVELLLDGEVSDRATLTFGVRTFELRSWLPHLNGQRFLIKGNNYPPSDMRIATVPREQIELDLRLARECHMNLLRVHAHVDHPMLYELADETGMLLWQDFPLQWVYDESVLPEAKRQVREMVRLLGSHPSIGVWCMHNEAFLIEDTADESLLARLRTTFTAVGPSWNRDVMDTQLKALVEAEDPTRPAVRSSGEFDIPYVRSGTDCHAYFGWYKTHGSLDDAEMMQRRFPGNLAFVTEFGTQSFPNLESARRFMPDPLTEADIAELMARRGFQGEIMSHWIPWREADGLAEMVALSQDYQIFINRYYIDRLRHFKYRPTGGIVPFLFVDPYPAILWSVVDYWRVPKRSYYAMQTAFRPQYAYAMFHPRAYALGEPIELPIFAVNDAQRPVRGARVFATLSDPAGATIAESARSVDLGADCLPVEVDRLRLTPSQRGHYCLSIRLTGVEHEVDQVYEIAVGGA